MWQALLSASNCCSLVKKMKPLSRAGHLKLSVMQIFIFKCPIKSQFWLLALLPAQKYPKELYQQERTFSSNVPE